MQHWWTVVSEDQSLFWVFSHQPEKLERECKWMMAVSEHWGHLRIRFSSLKRPNLCKTSLSLVFRNWHHIFYVVYHVLEPEPKTTNTEIKLLPMTCRGAWWTTHLKSVVEVPRQSSEVNAKASLQTTKACHPARLWMKIMKRPQQLVESCSGRSATIN